LSIGKGDYHFKIGTEGEAFLCGGEGASSNRVWKEGKMGKFHKAGWGVVKETLRCTGLVRTTGAEFITGKVPSTKDRWEPCEGKKYHLHPGKGGLGSLFLGA